MKKYIIALGLLLGFTACSDDYYESMNIDQSNPSEVPADFLVTSATTRLFNQMTSANVNQNIFRFIAQYFTATTYLDEPNYEINDRNISGNHWNVLYDRVLFDLVDAREIVEDDMTLLPGVKANQLATIEIMQIYTWQILVDTFGDIPYSEALQGADNIFPQYDGAAGIYSDLISRAETVIGTIDTSSPGFGSADLVYGGDMTAWKKAAASLLVRLGVTLADVNASAAQSAINAGLNAGVFTSNDDNWILPYLDATPYVNPLYQDLVLSGRSDYVAANTIIDVMNDLEDPRLPIYFDGNLTDDAGNTIYKGGIYGDSNPFANSTHMGPLLYTPTLPGVLLDYAEVEFLLAEAAMKGISVPGSVESHYEAGIRANMDYWGVSTSAQNAYLDRADVAWGSAPGTAKEKLAKQFWIGMYNRGFEGWNVWRRLDAPAMNLPVLTGNPVPHRMTYPVSERTLNPSGYNQGTSGIGGDEQSTKLFWDVH